jgi:hypothetical protein
MLSGAAINERVVQEFLELAVQFDKFGLMFRMLDENPSSGAFVAACVAQASKQPYASQLLTPGVVVQRWEFLASSLGERTSIS